ncbi:MAG: heavy metal translocating P-type ATPase [Phycisphaerales bacterium]
MQEAAVQRVELPVPPDSVVGGGAPASAAPVLEATPAWRDPQLVVAVLAGVTLLLGVIVAGGSSGIDGGWLVWASLALGAIYGVKAAVGSIRELQLNIDVLMIVGAGLSAWIGHPAEGALLLFMFTLAGALEHRALAKAKDAVTRLTKLMPTRARVRDASGAWAEKAADELVEGDVVQVRPGETVPADAEVVSGRTEVDTSALTGESLPRSVEEGSPVYAGWLNHGGGGTIEARVTRPVGKSSLNRVLEMVIEAQERKQPVQRMIDRVSTPYTVGVFTVALGAVAWFVWGAGLGWTEAAYRAITFLIVASPCALVIATPTVTLCGLSRAARSGLLIKGGDALERLASVRTVALDKTGTLTLGKISVVSSQAFGEREEVLARLAAEVESHSTHPLASAICAWAVPRLSVLGESCSEEPQTARLSEDGKSWHAVEDVRNVPGLGLEGMSREHGRVRVGRFEWACEGLPSEVRAGAAKAVVEARAAGALVAVASTSRGALVIVLADTPRPGAERLVSRLRDAGVEKIAMLTGDHRAVAEKVANELGIEIVHAELMPEQKVEKLRELKAASSGGGLAIVGDGVNDAPALAVADVGLAMGGIGSGAALEAADVVVLNDDLAKVPWAFALARRVRRVMIVNLVIALGVIAVLATLALAGVTTLGVGVVGHEGSTLVVVGLSLTILWFEGPKSLTEA